MPQVPPLQMRSEWDLLEKTAYTTCEAIKTTHRKGFVRVCKNTGKTPVTILLKEKQRGYETVGLPRVAVLRHVLREEQDLS